MPNELSHVKKLVVTAMLIALCVILPLAFHSIPRAGSVILPMHIPILLAGLIVGWKYGLIAGLLGPFLSHHLTGMPPNPVVYAMMIELATYGLVAGIFSQFIRTKRSSFDLYISLIAAMLVGRVVAGVAQFVYFFGGTFLGGRYVEGVYHATYPLAMWLTSYFATSLPGIVIQLAFIPSVVMALERERVIPLRYPVKA